MNLFSKFPDLYADLAAAALEFLGTSLFLLLGLGGVQAAINSSIATPRAAGTTLPSTSQLMYIATSMGLSLLVSAWLFFRVTGGSFNPNVSTALLLVGAIKPFRFILFFIAQLLGSILAVGLLKALTPGPLSVGTAPAPGVSDGQAVCIEMILTAALVMAVLMLAAEKHRSTAFAPVGIGLTLFAGHLWGVLYTGASMNTARSFGPGVILGFQPTQWIYWVGPTLGALLSTAIYAGLKHFKYDQLNPEQDTEDSQFSPTGPIRTLAFNPLRRPSLFTGKESEHSATNVPDISSTAAPELPSRHPSLTDKTNQILPV